jgi:hypothetical protein
MSYRANRKKTYHNHQLPREWIVDVLADFRRDTILQISFLTMLASAENNR